MSAAGTPHSDRYSVFTDEQLDATLNWLMAQGAAAWSKRFKVDGDYLVGDLRGMPPLVRQMLREQFEAMELMTPAQIRELMLSDVKGRVQLVERVLREAGR
jgi:hypothetical protein